MNECTYVLAGITFIHMILLKVIIVANSGQKTHGSYCYLEMFNVVYVYAYNYKHYR